MARRCRTRRVGGPALQRRSGRESRSHHPRAEKRSAADYYCRAEPGCADATSRASRRARKVSDAAQGRCSVKSSCARESNESSEGNEARGGKKNFGKNCIGKNSAGENKLSPAQRIKKFS